MTPQKESRMAKKRVVVISDMHCGHLVGLTPPGWQLQPAGDDEVYAHRRAKWAAIQRECWTWYVRKITSLRPIHLLLVVGDAIDGKGERSGGTELLTSDRHEQVDIALKCIQQAKAKHTEMVYGTPYHTGVQEDWENDVASTLGCPIGSHGWAEVNGVCFDYKHFLAASSIPHGRATPLLKEDLWNALWAEHEDQPRADIILRAHVHYHLHVGGVRKGRKWKAMSLPSLQAMGTKYGGRKCSGHVDYGLVWFDVDSNGRWSWEAEIPEIKSQRAAATKY